MDTDLAGALAVLPLPRVDQVPEQVEELARREVLATALATALGVLATALARFLAVRVSAMASVVAVQAVELVPPTRKSRLSFHPEINETRCFTINQQSCFHDKGR